MYMIRKDNICLNLETIARIKERGKKKIDVWLIGGWMEVLKFNTKVERDKWFNDISKK